MSLSHHRSMNFLHRYQVVWMILCDVAVPQQTKEKMPQSKFVDTVVIMGPHGARTSSPLLSRTVLSSPGLSFFIPGTSRSLSIFPLLIIIDTFFPLPPLDERTARSMPPCLGRCLDVFKAFRRDGLTV